MSNSRFTTRDGLALMILLGILSALTIAIWVPLHFFTPIDIAVSDIYVLSCVLLLAAHLIRLHLQTIRRSRRNRETTRS